MKERAAGGRPFFLKIFVSVLLAILLAQFGTDMLVRPLILAWPGIGFYSDPAQWLIVALLSIVPALLTAWLLSYWLSTPIAMILSAAERLGKDPRVPPIPVQGPAEVRAAAAIFNRMQDRLQRYVDSRTMMVAAIAHDLRTPMLRMRFKLDRVPDEFRRGILNDVGEMNEMVDSVLVFVRELHDVRPRQILELRSIIEGVVDDFIDLGADVGLVSGPALSIAADASGMTALIRNLVGNAVQHGRTVRVGMTSTDGTVEICVDDDGPGIPADELERVFAPFYRVEATRDREPGGAGLGLATVQAITSMHGGHVALANRTGGGLRATVTLPL